MLGFHPLMQQTGSLFRLHLNSEVPIKQEGMPANRDAAGLTSSYPGLQVQEIRQPKVWHFRSTSPLEISSGSEQRMAEKVPGKKCQQCHRGFYLRLKTQVGYGFGEPAVWLIHKDVQFGIILILISFIKVLFGIFCSSHPYRFAKRRICQIAPLPKL